MAASSRASSHLGVDHHLEKDHEKEHSNIASSLPSSNASIAEKEREEALPHDDVPSTKEGEIDGGALARVESGDYPTKMKLWIILLAVVLSIFLVALDMTIVATAIPRITDEFKSLQDVGWYGSAFFLTVASFQSTWGKAYKYFPLKSTFLLSIFIFEIGSLMCGVAKNSTTLIVGRAIAGAGGAGIASGAYTIIAFSTPPEQTAAYTGILGAIYAVASVVGPLLGGVFTDNLSWRWCFYINLPIGGVSVAMIVLFFKAPKKAKPVAAHWKEKVLQMDLPGTFILMAAAVCLILALQWGGVTKAWGSADVIGTLVGFVVIIALFIGFEIWQDDYALIVPRLMKKKTIALISGFQFVNSGVFLLLLYYLPIYFQVVSGVSAANSGVRNLPYVMGISLLTIASGIYISVTGRYVEILILGSVLSAVGSGMIYTFDIGTPSPEWIGYQALCGIGLGLSIQVPIIVAQAVVEPQDVSSITAIMIFFQTFAGAIFVSVSQSLFANKLTKRVPELLPGVQPGLVIGTGATELRKVFTPEQLPKVVRAYMDGLKDAYILAIALGGVAVLWAAAAVVLDRRNLKGKVNAAGAA